MAIRRILRGDEPALHKVCKPVGKIDKRTIELLDDLADTMYKADGAGLAAPQVGILRRVVVIDAGDGLIEMINPEILMTEGEEGCMEGCLSFPGEPGYVVRPYHVVARAMDRLGEWREYDAEGLFARAILHETDHLDGKLFTRLVTEPPEGFDEGGEDNEENQDKEEA